MFCCSNNSLIKDRDLQMSKHAKGGNSDVSKIPTYTAFRSVKKLREALWRNNGRLKITALFNELRNTFGNIYCTPYSRYLKSAGKGPITHSLANESKIPSRHPTDLKCKYAVRLSRRNVLVCLLLIFLSRLLFGHI